MLFQIDSSVIPPGVGLLIVSGQRVQVYGEISRLFPVNITTDELDGLLVDLDGSPLIASSSVHDLTNTAAGQSVRAIRLVAGATHHLRFTSLGIGSPVLIVDESAHAHAQQRIVELQRQIEQLIEHSGVLYALFDGTIHADRCNTAFRELIGADENRWPDQLGVDAARTLRSSLQSVLHGDRDQLSFLLHCQSGKVLALEARRGRDHTVILRGEDISRIDHLRGESSLLRSVVDDVGDLCRAVTMVFNSDGVVVDLIPRRSWLGWGIDEVRGKPLLGFARPVDLPTAERMLGELRAGTRTHAALTIADINGREHATTITGGWDPERARGRITIIDAATDALDDPATERQDTRSALGLGDFDAAVDASRAGVLLVFRLDQYAQTMDGFFEISDGRALLHELRERAHKVIGDTTAMTFRSGTAYVHLDGAKREDTVRLIGALRDAYADPLVLSSGELWLNVSYVAADRRADSGMSSATLRRLCEVRLRELETEALQQDDFLTTDRVEEMRARFEALERVSRSMRSGRADGCELIFMPQVSPDGERTAAIEALFRFRAPGQTRQFTPAELFSYAEPALDHLIHAWVVREATRWMAEHGGEEVRLRLNVSLREINRPNFLQWLYSETISAGLEPSRILVDLPKLITAGVAVSDHTLYGIGALLASGFGVACHIQDSAYLLSRMPVGPTQINIDREVWSRREDSLRSSMIHITSEQAERLSIPVCVTGVENAQDRADTVNYGVTWVQGSAIGTFSASSAARIMGSAPLRWTPSA